ncbi:hypothetical protein WA026_016146 [Henosepilachna vigintioctopunctata]|uniref:Uncharacterized protein n=1 Tax=Henosepilachna vigintioctopunctata TaxID=420089 RepID=A0AAW1TWM6_9CUCU
MLEEEMAGVVEFQEMETLRQENQLLRRIMQEMEGQGDKGNNKYFFEGKSERPEGKKIWLFLSKVRDSVDASTTPKYIQERTESQLSEISVEELSTRNQSQNNECWKFPSWSRKPV